jgi:hypothetical protein
MATPTIEGVAVHEKQELRGRPKKRPAERRRNRIMLNLTDDEFAALVEAAAQESPADYAREIVLRHLRRQAQ